MGVGSRRGVTSADVAREVGLSRTTVSFVLNDTPHQKIPDETRQKVLAAASKLGYTPSAAARALASGRSDVVLYLLPDWPFGPTAGSLLEYLSASFEASGFAFVVHPRAHITRPLSQLWTNITPAAVLAFDDFTDEELASMRAAGIQATVAMFGRTGAEAGGMTIAEQRVGRLQVEHLAATGHRTIGYAYPDDARLDHPAALRFDGARQACIDLGLEEPIRTTVALSIESALTAVRAFRDADPPVTAVCAYNDDVALALLAACRQLKVAVPEDLAVIGVDNVPAAAFCAPPLTTITHDIPALAQQIADSVIRTLAGRPPPRRPQSYAADLVQRSTA
jgi:DNA-binding LacI/PurR family transcriptional regulator